MNQNVNISGSREPQPTEEQIAVTAYHLYVQNGCQHGHDFEDWLWAEKLLTQKLAEELAHSNAQPARKLAHLFQDIHPAASRERPLARDERGSPDRKAIRQMAPRRPASRH